MNGLCHTVYVDQFALQKLLADALSDKFGYGPRGYERERKSSLSGAGAQLCTGSAIQPLNTYFVAKASPYGALGTPPLFLSP
jgi:hypothetical protein